MENFKGLAHIGLFTEDIEKSKGFYMDNFNFKLEHEVKVDKPAGAWLKIAFLNLNGMVIELLEPSDKTGIKKGNDGCVDHLAIEVKELELLMENLRLKGITFETEKPIKVEKLFRGVQVAFFRGPGGERLELFEYLA